MRYTSNLSRGSSRSNYAILVPTEVWTSSGEINVLAPTPILPTQFDSGIEVALFYGCSLLK